MSSSKMAVSAQSRKPHFVLCRGKVPVHRWKTPATSEEVARHQGNIGVVPGSVGRVVVDVDSGNPGRLIERHPPAAVLPTPSGGRHLVYTHPGGTIGNSQWEAFGCRGDLRADRGFVVQWSRAAWDELLAMDRAAPFPEELLPGSSPPRDDHRLARLRSWTAKAVADVANAGNGSRNMTLNACAHGVFRRWIGEGRSTEEPWAQLAQATDLPAREVRATLASALAAAEDRPTTLPDLDHIMPRSGHRDVPGDRVADPLAGFVMQGVDELLSEPEPEMDWLVNGLLTVDGISMVVAKPKVGKSTLARCLVAAVAGGTDFLGMRTVQAPVVHIAMQERRGTLRKHWGEMGFNGRGATVVYTVPPLYEARMAGLGALIEKTDAKLVIIDQLADWTASRIEDGNDYQAVVNAIGPLRDFAREKGVHVCVLHHSRKAGGDDGDEVLGSTAYFGTCDVLISLHREKRGRSFGAIGREGVDIEKTALRFSDGKLTRGDTVENEAMALLAEAITEELSSVQPMKDGVWGWAELKATIGGRAHTQAAARRHLKDRGGIVEVKRERKLFLHLPGQAIPEDPAYWGDGDCSGVPEDVQVEVKGLS